MSAALAAAKAALRREARAVLAAVPADDRRTAGEQIVAPLLARVHGIPAPIVALFASMPLEISTVPLDDALRAAGVTRALPAIAGNALVFRLVPPDVAAHALPREVLGIPTPPPSLPAVALADCALVVVPGLAFDVRGHRLGHGRGYYDRALAGVHVERCVGVGLDEQLVADVPVGPHDVVLRWLCTPARGVFRCEGAATRL